jgi:hypothetical protein
MNIVLSRLPAADRPVADAQTDDGVSAAADVPVTAHEEGPATAAEDGDAEPESEATERQDIIDNECIPSISW